MPEPVTVELRDNEKTATKDSAGNDLPTFSGHIFSDVEGKFPVKLSPWETMVIEKEIDRRSFVAWTRNPSKATPAALRIAYQDDAGAWTSLQVDFLVISRRDDETLAASIIDLHRDYLADATAKLRALADFADTHGGRFLRIQSIAELSDGTLQYLDLQDLTGRSAL